VKNPQAKKHLGQNFLNNKGVIEKIAARIYALSDQGKRPVLELASGPGALTRALLDKGLNLLCVEIDPDCIGSFHSRFQKELDEGRVKLIQADALKHPLEDFFGESETPADWVVCGNLPYYIGTALLFRFLRHSKSGARFSFMLQKELVDRLLAAPGKKDYGLSSIRQAWLALAERDFVVAAGSFTPAPKVDSAVLSLERSAKKSYQFGDSTEQKVLYDEAVNFVGSFFKQRRKMLRTLWKEVPLDFSTRRPDSIDPSEWYDLWLENSRQRKALN